MSRQLISEPLTLPCGTTVPSRLAKAAMSEQLAHADGRPSQTLIDLYEAWGAGGAGLLITGNVMVDRRAFVEPRNAVLEDDRHLADYEQWAQATKSGGSVALMQISHPGRLSVAPLTRTPVAPSAVRPPVVLYNLRKPRALTLDEIDELRARFVRTAELAIQAGFDGVQIHAAHGYLLSQFLTPASNQRTDRYGGTPANRRRLLLEIVQETRAEIGPNPVVSVKLNSADFHRGGMTEEESLDVALALGHEGVDLLEISGGNYESPVMFGDESRTAVREAYFLRYAERLRERTQMRLMLTGGFRSRHVMEQALADGAVDVIGLARPLAIVPDLPARLLAGGDTPVLPRPPRIGGPLATPANAYMQLTWHGAYFRRIAAGAKQQPDWGFTRTLATALVRTGLNLVTQS